MKGFLVLLILALPCLGQENANDPHHLYTWSTVALGASNSLDAFSSWGKLEANPVLASQTKYSWQATVIKGGVVGGILLTQRWILHKHPQYTKSLAITNFAMSGAFTGVAIHNFGVAKPK
jgi:hypothetical protein